MMKSMKGLSMNKVFGSIKRRPINGGRNSSHDGASDEQGDTPEAVAARSVRAFCESGGPNNTGDEVTFLPPIVESAESSPAAAAECARILRKFLKREYWTKPSYQYNALMLLRILSDNPGQTFTRNLDAKFVDTAKDLLKNGRDLSVRQMLMETLDSFENTKGYDEGLGLIIEMWRKEKQKALKAHGGQQPPAMAPRALNAPAFDPHSQNYFARSHNNKRLPGPDELANRLEEARTSAKLLTQVVACTPPAEVLDNDLIKEFADRCLSASRSIQIYMTAQDPGPDNETMENLIDTNEQLQQALNQHQRAVLSARKTLGIGDRSQNPSPTPPPEVNGSSRPSMQDDYSSGSASLAPPLSGQRPAQNGKGKGKETAGFDDYVPPPPGPPPGRPPVPGPSRSANITPNPPEVPDDPFRDPELKYGRVGASGKAPARDDEPRFAHEPFHPGFSNKPTQSYLGRQDSAFDKVQMHGAGSASHDDDKEVVIPNQGAGAASGSSRYQGKQTRVSDEDLYHNDDEEVYGPSAKAKSKQPMYRY